MNFKYTETNDSENKLYPQGFNPKNPAGSVAFFLVCLATGISIFANVILRTGNMDLFRIMVSLPTVVFLVAFIVAAIAMGQRGKNRGLATAALSISGYVLFRWVMSMLINGALRL